MTIQDQQAMSSTSMYFNYWKQHELVHFTNSLVRVSQFDVIDIYIYVFFMYISRPSSYIALEVSMLSNGILNGYTDQGTDSLYKK